MPLKKKKTSFRKKQTPRLGLGWSVASSRSTSARSKLTRGTSASYGRALTHQVFFPIVVFTLVLWFLYRSLFSFPVWFDESLGKAIFFGLPAWIYVSVTGFRPIIDSFRLKKLWPGLFSGLAIGGIFGFVTIFIRLLQHGGTVQPGLVFLADRFWIEMLWGLLTAFWETVFFFSFVMTVVQDRFTGWPLFKQVVLVTLIFLLFHIPNLFLRFDLGSVFPMLSLLTLFATGQSLLFAKKQNAYLLVISQVIWGMVLLIYF